MRKMILMTLMILTLSLASSLAYATTIEWWQFATDPSVKPTISAMVEEFEQANPDIEVNVTDLTWSHGHEKIVLAFASGAAPDVVELGSDWIAQFAENGHLANITTHAAKSRADYQGWSMALYKDSIYAQPWYLGTRVLYYNTDLLKRVGYKEDQIVLSIDSLEPLVKKIHALGRDIYGFGANAPEKHRLYKKFLPFFWTNGSQFFSDSGGYLVLSSTYAIEALEQYKSICMNSGLVASQRKIEDAFLEGKVGVVFSGDWLLKRIKKERPNLKFSTGPFPGHLYPGNSFMGGEFLAISAQSEEKEAAQKFIDFITSPENQLRFCKANQSANPSSVQAQRDAYFTSDKNLMTFIRQIHSAKHPPVHPDWVHIETILEKAIEDALFKDVPAADALYEARTKIAEILAKR